MQLQDLRQIQNHYSHIYIAPHFDDAAISCGGAIARYIASGQAVLVITVCGGQPSSTKFSPFARYQHRIWNAHDNPTALRRQEDQLAIAHLGADFLWLPELDAIYRHPAYSSDAAIFGDLMADDPLPQTLYDRLSYVADLAAGAIYYFPLAVGNHVDHQAAFLAGCRLAERGLTVAFYEDLPYALASQATEERLEYLRMPLLPDIVNISRTLPHKLGAVAEYRSQIPVLFQSEENMVEALTHYSAQIAPEKSLYGERLWLRGAGQ